MLQWPVGITTFRQSPDFLGDSINRGYFGISAQVKLPEICCLKPGVSSPSLTEAEPCIDELRLLVAIQSCPVLLTVTYLALDASYPLRYRVD